MSSNRVQTHRRTACNRAALVALGLLAIGGAPARAAAPGTVLPPNTIPVLRGLVSDYSKSATFNTVANTGGAGQTLTINQLLPKIILDWNSFDIGNGSIVQFVQPSATSAVLNRIYSLDPTIVQGAIKANGQVYLVNQNGILFDRGAQINTNTLVASTLNIDDSVFMKSLTDGGMFTPAFSGGYDSAGRTVAGAKSGTIVLGANGAATAAAPTITAQTGGAVVIIAPVIDNRSGIITSPDGQVILAAGNAAYLGFSARDNTGFRGMLVEVTADNGPVNLSSMVRNAGTISSDRGNVTLAGLAINQQGRVSAKSAMLTNGSIYLQASTLNDAQRGTVTLAADSVTETPLDLADTTTLRQSDSFVPYRPVINIDGAQIDVDGRITSPSGAVALTAQDPANKAGARIFMGSGSLIDASGVWSDASDTSNLLTFKVTSNELKDSPDQKGGLLAGATVTVDLRASSTLLDLSGYQANQARTLAQKAAAGGAVTLTSSGSVVQQTGATIDVAGGGVHYTGATESTTHLLGSDGKIYDIGSAPEGLHYTAIADAFVVNQARWGYSQTYTNLLSGSSIKRPDFTEGAVGGSLLVSMASTSSGLVLDGQLLAGATTGSQQLAAAPNGGSLTLGAVDTLKTSQDFGIGDVTFISGAATTLPAGFGLGTALSDARKTQVTLSSDVFSAATTDASGNVVTTGFSDVSVNANGRITVPENVAINGPTGGTLTLQANQVAIDGRISVPAGTVTARTLSTAGTAASPVSASGISLIQGASVDTSGAWINNSALFAPTAVPTAVTNSAGVVGSALNGGAIVFDSVQLQLATGSTLDVSAGGSESAGNAFSGGSGGSISLTASSTSAATPLALGSTLKGYGFANGGSLSLSTGSALQIGASGSAATSGVLSLDAGFFAQGGFQSYSLTASKDLTVASGTVVQPKQVNLQLPLAQKFPTGTDIADAAQQVTLADNVRNPASVALSSSAGKLVVQAGSAIDTDPGGSVRLSGATGAAIDGSVVAPGGAISVTVNAADQQSVTPVLELGARGALWARGTFTPTPSDRGLVQGNLMAGGSVTLTASKAAIALDTGSVIDVSGATQTVDVPAVPGATSPYTQVQQASNAGTVSIVANDTVALDGAIRGNASGSAAGGSFALTLTRRGDFADPDSGRRIVVTQSSSSQTTATGFKDVDLSVDKLTGAGFDKLHLKSEDQIVFSGDTTLDFNRGVTLDSNVLQVANDANVRVLGTSVTLANTFGARFLNNPGDPSDPRTTADATLPAVPQATLAGKGTFSVDAGTLDVFGSVTISGTQTERLVAANDLRLSGRTVGSAGNTTGAQLVGSLTAAADLDLTAAQIYPTTASSFSIAVADGLTGTPTANGTLTIARGTGILGNVYSAGGSLTLAADNIVQDGVLKAPLGSLNLDAGKTLTLGGGSVTSVSANGLVIPYGETQSGVTWTYAATGSDPTSTALTAPPVKKIALTSPAIDVLPGATVDVSGGGDLAAIEFIPGSGGSKSALIQPNTYAIIPAANLSAAPIDPDIALAQNLGFGSDSAVYNSIHIGAGGAVPAGDYVLLPGYYALLKGGYSVQLLPGSTYANLQAGQTATLKNGLTIVPGSMTAAGTDVASSTTIGVLVQSGSAISKSSDYTVTSASYFATLANADRAAVPLLPTDGGQLTIAATDRLTLNGTLQATLPTAASRSAEVDITASKIALVDQVGRGDIAPGYLQIDSDSLTRLDASLLIGGVRATTSTGETVTPSATDIVVANSAAHPLQAPEIVLAATDSITVSAGSKVDGSGTNIVKAQDFTVVGPNAASGAIVRVSNGALVDIARGQTDASQGTITVEAGATLSASGSLALDATRTTTSRGNLDVAAGGSLALVSGSLSLGQTDGVAGLDSGLVLDNAQLAGFTSLGTLSLKSYNGIDLYGQTQIGTSALSNLVIDAASLVGHAGADGTVASAQLVGKQVTLQASSGSTPVAPASNAAAGTFNVTASQISLGEGDKAIGGFSDTQFDATGEILASGKGSLRSASPIELQAARIASTSGADQVWTAQDGTGMQAVFRPVTITGVAGASTLSASTALGSRLQVIGSTVADNGSIVMKSGVVTLQAEGSASSDGVIVGSGALIDASGATKSFQGTPAIADAGQVTLASANGAVQLLGGSSVDVSAAAAGGNAGTLSIIGTSATLAGTLAATSAQGTQGQVSLDVGSLGDFSALNAKLSAAGFTEQRDVRVRSGDITVAAGDTVTARRVVLEADSGSVNVNGRVDASASLGGGSVEISATDVAVAAGAVIDASATSTGSTGANGGSVALVAEGGTLAFAQGAVIDVRAGAQGTAGSVLLRAPRTPNSVDVTLAGQVLSQRHAGDPTAQVVVEGNRVYGPATTGSTVTQAMIDGYGADNVAFMSTVDASTLAAGIRGDDGAAQGNVHVRPAVEIQAAGDLTIAANWTLTGPGWITPSVSGTGSEAGSLVVRAGGTLTLAGVSIGNPDTNVVAGPTWNIGLVGGADLGASNAFRVQTVDQLAKQVALGTGGAGDVVLDSAAGEASVRTGTGAIRIAAGRDFAIAAGTDANGQPLAGVVTTTGSVAIVDPVAGQDRFTQGGGNITISATRDALGAGNEWMTEWYRSGTDLDGGPTNGAWWSYRPNFHDGIATFGGGNVAINAGRDVVDLSAWAPTSGLQVGTASTAGLATFGGGSVAVRAGNDIVGGQYLASRGRSIIAAGGDVGAALQGSQLFITGASGNAASAGAAVTISAGGAITLNTIDNPASLQQTSGFSSVPSFNQGSALPVLSLSASDSVAVTAKGGDIRIGNRPAANLTLDPDNQGDIEPQSGTAAILPPKVAFTSFSGDIVYDGTSDGLIAFPSASGGVKLLAGGGITGINLRVSDADASQLAVQNISLEQKTDFAGVLSPTPGVPNRVVSNASTDTYVNDVVALGGDVRGDSFFFPARSRIWAAGDVVNTSMSLQNLQATDISAVVADKGSITINQLAGWGIDGPGTLLLQAGQDIDLGKASLTSFGNVRNQGILDADGANIVLAAGTSGTFEPSKLDDLFAKLVTAGGAKDKAAARTAVDTFFATDTLQAGNIRSFNTSIQSNAGGSVNLLAPMGNITVGLTTPNSKLIGVVTNAGGAIRSYLNGDFDINQGKVLTAQGGDILIYTSEGGIDAGRGAKTSVTTPPPLRTPHFDADGNLTGYTYSVPVAVAGSGIQTATSKPNGPTSVAPPAGNIYLFAPAGTIDAGEAGIASGGSIFIAALTVLNADNITSVGTSVGVPQVAVGSVASTVAASGATNSVATTAGADAATQAASAAAAAGVTNFRAAILTVEVMGFGDKNCKETDKDCFAK